jgi:hypothetical protein
MEPRAAYLIGCAAILGVLGMLLASCGGPVNKREAGGGGAADSGGRPPASLETLGVSVGLDSGSYAIGETIKMRLAAVNRTGRPLVLEFATSQRFDFVVSAGGKPIWQWSADKMFGEVLGSETVQPGDSLVYEVEWDQRLGDGTNPGLGAYTIRGVLKALPEVASQEKRFGVVD